MKLLITGANGQLGRAIKRQMAGLPSVQALFTDVDTLDLTDAEAVNRVVADGQFSHIVNCAAYTAVDLAESDPQACRAANIDAVSNLASAARDADSKIIHISTDYVFDGKHNTPYTESDKTNPISEYGRSKRNGEMRLLDMSPDGIILRTSGLYSPDGKNFVKTMREFALANKKPKVVIDQLCTPTNADDLAGAIIKIIGSHRWLGGIYNYSNMGVTSWFDIAVEIFRHYGREASDVTPLLSRDYQSAAQRPSYSVLDKSLIRSTYGIAIPHWRQSLEKCLSELDRAN